MRRPNCSPITPPWRARPKRAVEYWRRAGVAATARPAYQEAIGHLTNAVSLVRKMGEGRIWLQRELDLQILLAQALIPKAGHSAEPTAAAFARALELVERIGDGQSRFPVLYGNWVGHFVRGDSAQYLAQGAKPARACRAAGRRGAAPRRPAARRHFADGGRPYSARRAAT